MICLKIFLVSAAIQLHILTLDPSIQSSASIYPDQRCMGGTIPAVQGERLPGHVCHRVSIKTTLTDVVIVTLLTGHQASGKAVYQNTPGFIDLSDSVVCLQLTAKHRVWDVCFSKM